MAARLRAARGVDTIIYLGVLTADQINADPFVAPSKTAVTETIVGAIAAAAESVTVPDFGVDIPAGSVIEVTESGVSYVLVVAADYTSGDTDLTIMPNGRAIGAGASASFYPLYRLVGGTNSDFQSQSNTNQTTVYSDPNINEGGWQSSTTLDQNWSFTYNALVFPNSGSYSMLSYIALHKDLTLYIERYIDPGAGSVSGHMKGGICSMTQYNEPADATAFVNLQCTFTGDLAPFSAEQAE